MSEPKPLLAPLKPEQTAPRLWKNGRFIDEVANAWQPLADDAPLPSSGRVLLSLARWRREAVGLPATEALAIGLQLAPNDEIAPATDAVQRAEVVVLHFPRFADGRAYSQARRLREAGFEGEIRATGDVLLDQLPLMLRTGFDAFEITSAATVRALEKGQLPAVSRIYQSAAETPARDWRARRTS